MLARHYGRKVSVAQLRRLVDYSRLGISIGDVLECCRRIGMRAHAVKIGIDPLMQIPLPAILYWNQNHYVVLYRIDRRKKVFYVADPAAGKLRFTQEEFNRHWKGEDGDVGVAIVAAPLPGFYTQHTEKQRSGHALIGLLRKSVVDNRGSFGLLAVLSLVSIVADIVLPLVFQKTIDDGIGHRDVGLVWLLVLGQLCVFAGSFVATSINDLVLSRMGLRVSIGMMNDYLAKLIRLPVSFFDKKVNSDFIQKIEDQNRLKGFLVSMPQTLFITALNLVVFSGMLIYYSVWVFVIFLIATAMSFGWTRLFLVKRREIDYSQFSLSSENRNNVYELVNGMPEIKVNNAQGLRVSLWTEIQHKINRLAMKLIYINLSVSAGSSLLSQLKDITITGLCATMVIMGDMTIGMMMTISYIVGRLSSPFSTIINSVSIVQDAALSYERLDEIINNHEDEQPEERGLTFADAPLVLTDVSFKYPGSYSPLVLRNLNIHIERGKTVAIVGASGCGKSTLIKLLLGFYLPTSGKMCVGEYDMAEINRDEWMRHCGVVSQQGYIFSGTILDNIALSTAEPDKVRAEEAAQLACISEFISGLPMGMHTRIGNAGVELSGGQKQRLLLARAIYKQPEILLLDEATSSLDAATERRIVENLKRVSAGKTVIIAAHRLSTVREADMIMFINEGRVTECGTHEELIERRGDYYGLVQRQL